VQRDFIALGKNSPVLQKTPWSDWREGIRPWLAILNQHGFSRRWRAVVGLAVAASGWWCAQAAVRLLDQSTQERVWEIPVDGPVKYLEDLSLIWFSGYRTKAN
jgi:hypothetical protein